MRRKGAIEFAALAAFSLMVILSSFGFLFNYQDAVKRKFQQETTDIVAERVAGDIQALSAYENRGQVEIKLPASKYGFQTRRYYNVDEINGEDIGGDRIYEINITYEGGSASYSNVSLDGGLDSEGGEGQYICLTKNGNIEAEVGEC